MDKDVKEMFREKNKTILLNNLKYDLEKNVNSLLETMINIFNLEFDAAIKNILAIYFDSNINDCQALVIGFINQMKLSSYEQIEKLLELKKKELEDYIEHLEFEESSLLEYYNLVLETTRKFKKDLNQYLVMEIQKQGIQILNQFASEQGSSKQRDLACNRITDYLKNRLFGKLETKIHMELMLRDNNLINKAKESYVRFQEISSKTTEAIEN